MSEMTIEEAGKLLAKLYNSHAAAVEKRKNAIRDGKTRTAEIYMQYITEFERRICSLERAIEHARG